jgi:hypothetical protein
LFITLKGNKMSFDSTFASISGNLASIAASLATIAEALKSRTPNDTRQAAAPVAVPAPVAAAPVVAAPAPIPAPVVEAAPAAPVQAAPACPITDQPSLVAYVMASYKEMGPVKGNQIQGVLAALGIANINEAKPEQYVAIHAGVEALKAQ